MIKIASNKNSAKMKTRLLLIEQLERRLRECICEEEKKHCLFCLEIIRNGYLEHFSEVYLFLGIEEHIVSCFETESIKRVLNMYHDIHVRMETMTLYEKNRLSEYLFNGFEESTQHGYYVFLDKHGFFKVPCNRYRPRRLEIYLEFVEKYEALGNNVSFNKLMPIFDTEKEVS